MNTTTSRVLKNLRKKHKISQPKLSKLIGISQQQISAWESGKHEISLTTFVLICNKIGDTDYNSIIQ
jgi:transcriptional regulator with XRE-family HTH domain